MKNKIMPYVRIVLFLGLIAVSIAVCDYIFSPYGYIRYILHEVNATEASYDTLVLGASHARSSINPQELNEYMGCNAINESIPGETVEDSYYLLEEAIKNNELKTVIFDMDFYYWFDQNENLFTKTFIASQMSLDDVKLSYIWNNKDNIDIRNAFSKRYSYKISLQSAKNNFYVRQSDGYKNYDIKSISIPDAGGPYVGLGFFNRVLSGKNPKGRELIDAYANCYSKEFDSNVVEYFKKIVETCKANDIRLVVVVTPVTPTAAQVQNFEALDEKFRTEIMEPLGVEYYNCNLLRMDVLPRRDRDYGDYEGHMGGEIGSEYSAVLGKIIEATGNGSFNRSDYFYESFADYFDNMEADYIRVTGERFYFPNDE